MQASLFDAPIPVRRTDPATSREAAEAIVEQLPRLEAVVLEAVTAAGKRGATSHEIADATGLSLVTVSPRLRPLARRGKVIESGQRRDGRIVWIATEE